MFIAIMIILQHNVPMYIMYYCHHMIGIGRFSAVYSGLFSDRLKHVQSMAQTCQNIDMKKEPGIIMAGIWNINNPFVGIFT